MKIRTDFVTNSSSSSFIIEKYKIPFEEREKVFEILNKLDILTPEDVMFCEYYREEYSKNDYIIEPEYDDNDIIRIYSHHDGRIDPELEKLLYKYGTSDFAFHLDVLEHIKQIYPERYKRYKDINFNSDSIEEMVYRQEKMDESKINQKGYKENFLKNFLKVEEEEKECEE